jgi:predicted protein tyrosine phosphatase
MHRIRPWLLIGRYSETCDLTLLAAHQVGAMLQLADPVPQAGIAHIYLPAEGGVKLNPSLLRRGVDFVLAQRAAGQIVLVACGAGISRSTTFAIAAVKEAEQLTLREAAQIVRCAHPDGIPHVALWESLCTTYYEPIDYLDLLRMHEGA